MKSPDTNVLIRYLVQDDVAHARLAGRVLAVDIATRSTTRYRSMTSRTCRAPANWSRSTPKAIAFSRVTGLRACADHGLYIEPAQSGDISIQSGKVTGLIGPDGTGKTTPMRLAAGLLRVPQPAVLRPVPVVGLLAGFPPGTDLFRIGEYLISPALRPSQTIRVCTTPGGI